LTLAEVILFLEAFCAVTGAQLKKQKHKPINRKGTCKFLIRLQDYRIFQDEQAKNPKGYTFSPEFLWLGNINKVSNIGNCSDMKVDFFLKPITG